MNLKHTRAERGVALVITLIMLSVVTITVVAFLAVARREQRSVADASEQESARLMADTAFARAKDYILSRAILNSNWALPSYTVSTNYTKPAISAADLTTSAADFPEFNFHTNIHNRWLTNVSYSKDIMGREWNLADPADAASYRAMLANLYYDPRPPVAVQTKISGSLLAHQEFRFYLDLNRNGRFETNGFVSPHDFRDQTNGFAPAWMYGDPEWIGILEHPDMPHSGRNRFVGRVAYVVVPASRTLNLNYAGNLAGKGKGTLGTYRRNQGVGAWEYNLGGFFRDLNTNYWRNTDYSYSSTVGAAGKAFTKGSDQIVAWRAQDPSQSLQSFVTANTGLGTPNIPLTLFHAADYYSDGPIKQTNLFTAYPGTAQRDKPSTAGWPGADPRRKVKDVSTELFAPAIWNGGNGTANASPFLDTTLVNEPYNTYQRYTYYRALQQLGTDTGDGRWESGTEMGGYYYYRPKLNINFDQDDPDGGYSNSAEPSFTGAVGTSGSTFRQWNPTKWMNYAVDRMLRTEFTNGLTRVSVLTSTAWINSTNQYDDSPLGFPLIVFGTTNPPGTSVRVPAQFVNYNAQVHRMAQLAANILDSTTNRYGTTYPYLPTVFRPLVFRGSVTNFTTNIVNGVITRKVDSILPALRLFGYEEVTNNLLNSLYGQWFDITTRDSLLTNKFIYDLDKVITVNKGQVTVNTNLMRVNIAGLPWVVGAKKGFPAFDESFSQTSVQVTRRMVVTKPAGVLLHTNQTAFDLGTSAARGVAVNYLFNVTNTFAADAWNSYLTNFPADRPIEVYTTNVVDFAVLDSSQTNLTTQPLGKPLVLNYYRNGRFYAYTNAMHVWTTNYFTVGGTGNKSYPSWPGRASLASYLPVFSNSIVTSFYMTTNVANPAYDGSFSYENALVSPAAPLPKIAIAVTNRLIMAIIDVRANRLIDIVNLKSVSLETNIMPYLALGDAGNTNNFQMPSFWKTNVTAGRFIPAGVSNQFSVSAAAVGLPQTRYWQNPPLPGSTIADATASLYYFLYGYLPPGAVGKVQFAQFVTNSVGSVRYQAGFTPSASVVLTDRRMANDPLVHYTMDDLGPGASIATAASVGVLTTLSSEAIYTPAGLYFAATNGTPDSKLVNYQIGTAKKVTMYAPWGANWALPWNSGNTNSANDPSLKDPLVRSSDDWTFPTNYFDTLGEIGRVHRGTPWQTIYLKSPAATKTPGNILNRYIGKNMTWAAWAGHEGTHPTNDWKLLQLFTTAINDNAAQGLMSVNQTNIAAWSALLSGTTVLDGNGKVQVIEPASKELYQIVGGNFPSTNPTNGVAPMNAFSPAKSFKHLGDIFSVPTLSVASPYMPQWNLTDRPMNVRDDIVERIPQQILPLIREDEPRFVIYSFAQTLKPAPGAIYTGPDKFYGLCTNYVVTGEYSTKTVLRFDGAPSQNQYRTVVESHELLPAPSAN